MAGDDDVTDGPDSPKDAEKDKDPGEQTLKFAGEDEMTLDAFQKAVSAAVADKLDKSPGSAPTTPRGADDMVASVLSALTGKDAKAALAEVREAMDNPKPQGEKDNVIDLGAEREARKATPDPISGIATGIGEALKQTFGGFIAQYASQHGQSASGEINLDAKFLRENGPQLLGTLFQSLAQALAGAAAPKPTKPKGPVDVDTVLDSGDEEPAAEPSDDAAAATRDNPPVNINLDMASILSALFRRRDPPKDS